MSQFKLLKEVITFLNQADTSYMLTGSIVSSFQGAPRSTHDKEKIDSLLLAFPSPTYYIDKDMVLDGIKSKKMFKLLNTETGDKIDFYPLPDNEYESVRFSRKIPEDINGLKVWITSVEDTIISKLRWCKLSNGSEKQFKDALNVFEVQYEILDFPYIDEWIRKLNLTDLYERLQKEREEL